MLTRRSFLQHGARGSALVSLAPAVPLFLTRSALAAGQSNEQPTILVVIQLDGGNDGINTVVPFRDEGYARSRLALRLPTERLIKLTDEVGLHPALRPLSGLWEAGRLSIVQGVGYPNPDRSHFRSMAIWQTARTDPADQAALGWIGQGLDSGAPIRSAPAAIHVGPETLPVALRGRRAVASSIVRPEQFQIVAANDAAVVPPQEQSGQPDSLTQFIVRTRTDAAVVAEQVGKFSRKDAASENYPATALGERLRLIARLIRGGLQTRVYYAVQAGYDTHAGQLVPHAALLRELAGAVQAFFEDLGRGGLARRVLLLAFSEFGRRVMENVSEGTDHGTAGPVLLAGGTLDGGLIGATPSLSNLDDGDLKMSVDFRQVYASVLENWLGISSTAALNGDFEPLPLLSA